MSKPTQSVSRRILDNGEAMLPITFEQQMFLHANRDLYDLSNIKELL